MGLNVLTGYSWCCADVSASRESTSKGVLDHLKCEEHK